jgi:hypothetical protein
MNKTSVTDQVNRIKSRPNLLLWYTADEPDGTTDPLDATLVSSNLITSLDGGDGAGGAGYHPVSLVLNCQDFHFTFVLIFIPSLLHTHTGTAASTPVAPTS